MSKASAVLKALGVSVGEGLEGGIKNYSDDLLLRVLSGGSDDVIGAVGALGDDVVATGMRRVVQDGVVKVINSETGAVLAEVSEASLKAMDDEIIKSLLREGAQELGESGLRLTGTAADDVIGAADNVVGAAADDVVTAGAREATEEVARVSVQGLDDALAAATEKTAAEAAEIFAQAGIRNASQLGKAAQQLFAGNVDEIVEFGLKSGVGKNAAGVALTGRAQGRAIGDFAKAAGIGRGQVDELVKLATDLGLEPTRKAMAGFARGAGLNSLRSTEMTEVFVTKFLNSKGLAQMTSDILPDVVNMSKFTATRAAGGALSLTYSGIKNAPTIVKTVLTVGVAGGIGYGGYQAKKGADNLLAAINDFMDKLKPDTPEEAAAKLESAQTELAATMLPRGDNIPEGSEVFYEFREVNGREMTYMNVIEPGSDYPREIATGYTKDEFLAKAAEIEKKHGVEKDGQGMFGRVMDGAKNLLGGMSGGKMLLMGGAVALGGLLLSGLIGQGIGAATGVGFLGGMAGGLLKIALPIVGLVIAGVGVMSMFKGRDKGDGPSVDSPLASEVTRERGGRDGNERTRQRDEGLSDQARAEAREALADGGANGVREGDPNVTNPAITERDREPVSAVPER